jgi:hypothetical protein
VTTPLERGAPAEAVTVMTGAGEGQARAAIWGPHLPLAAVQSPGGLSRLAAARQAQSPAEPGEWLIAVWRTGRARAFAPGHFLQSAPVTCGVVVAEELISSLALTRMMAGGGLFDIDGNLRAVVLPCDARFVAVTTASIESIVKNADSLEQRLLARFGLVVGALAEDEQTYFKASRGVIVREVWSGYGGDEAGVQPGDIILTLSGRDVTGPDDLRPLAEPPGERPFELTVQRGTPRGSMTLTIAIATGGLAAAGAAQGPPGPGLVWESPQEGYRIDAVSAGSRAASVGIEPGDRLISINHVEPRSLAQVQRIFAGDRALPVFLEIARDGRRLGMLVR